MLVGTTSVEVIRTAGPYATAVKEDTAQRTERQAARPRSTNCGRSRPAGLPLPSPPIWPAVVPTLSWERALRNAGGLAIIGTERHESRRVDRQLRGRAGRQGDPGSSQFFSSLEDDLMRMFGSDRIAGLMDRMGYKEGEVIQHSMITKSIERAQKKVEENNFGIRKRLLEYDDVMNKQRNVIYTRRRHALFGERLALDLDNAFYSSASDLIQNTKDQNDFEAFKLGSIVNLGIDSKISKEDFEGKKETDLVQALYEEALNSYNAKNEELAKQAIPVFQNIRQHQGAHIENVVVPFTDGRKAMQVLANLDKTIVTGGHELVNAMERNITLGLIDDEWKEHLRNMDDLKQSVQTASYEQKDPLVIYKIEAYKLFEGMQTGLNKQIVQFLCHSGIPVEQEQDIRQGREQRTDMSRMKQRKENLVPAGEREPAMISQGNNYHDPSENIKQEPIKVGPKIGRNDPCPCGSGKKFKQCHGKDL